MKNKLDKFFKIEERGSSITTEIISGLTIFFTMAYVLAVQPSAIIGFGPHATFTDASGLLAEQRRIACFVRCCHRYRYYRDGSIYEPSLSDFDGDGNELPSRWSCPKWSVHLWRHYGGLVDFRYALYHRVDNGSSQFHRKNDSQKP